MTGELVLLDDWRIDRKLASDTLTLAELKELEDAGYITRAASWQAWLSPDIPHWIGSVEYGAAFDKIAKEETSDA